MKRFIFIMTLFFSTASLASVHVDVFSAVTVEDLVAWADKGRPSSFNKDGVEFSVNVKKDLTKGKLEEVLRRFEVVVSSSEAVVSFASVYGLTGVLFKIEKTFAIKLKGFGERLADVSVVEVELSVHKTPKEFGELSSVSTDDDEESDSSGGSSKYSPANSFGTPRWGY